MTDFEAVPVTDQRPSRLPASKLSKVGFWMVIASIPAALLPPLSGLLVFVGFILSVIGLVQAFIKHERFGLALAGVIISAPVIVLGISIFVSQH